MGYFLEQAGYRYTILEAEDRAGSFYTRQPRHRKLISFNKRHNWFTEADFNLRYDWNSLLTYDSALRFPDYSDELYPHADRLVEYLNDFAERFALKIEYNTRVESISRDASGDFILTCANGSERRCRCLLMATGAVKPRIPEEIEGIELAEGYEVHDIDPERFTNKRVLILGNGNSAFEVANHLSSHAATIQIYTGGRLVKHAWQSHFVGDLRAVNNTMLEMNQIKIPFLLSGAKVTRIVRQSDGALRVYYEEDVPHWAVPGTMRSAAVYDYVIRATGWKYFDPSLFTAESAPEVDSKAKYPMLSPIWESSQPGLFYIGAAMSSNDTKATSGFIHGFRHNIRTLFHLLEERYHGVPLPGRTFPLTNEDKLEILVQAVLTRLSTTSALFQMFGVLADALVFSPGHVDWYPELPVQYLLRQPEFGGMKDLLTITLELGFDGFPKDTNALNFIHPNDPGGDGNCVAFIHPVLRHYRAGNAVSEVHLQSGVFVRYDAPNEEFAIEFDRQKPHHVIFNMINGIAGVIPESLIATTFTDSEIGGFTPWPPELRREEPELPQCIRTHQPDFKPDPAKYL